MKTELEKDYEVTFLKMYRDFANTCNAKKHFDKKNKTDLDELNKDFFNEQVSLYISHLGYLLNSIEDNFGKEKMDEVQKENTREFHFNEIMKMLSISYIDLINILKLDELELKSWFDLYDADVFKQDKIYKLYGFLIKLDEILKSKDLNYNLMNLLKYSFVDMSDYVFDEEDEDKGEVLTHVLSNWREKTDYELAYEIIENYKKRDSFKGDVRLININGGK